MKVLFYNPAPSQRRCTPYEALRGSPFFRTPNYDAMRMGHMLRKDDFMYVDEYIETLSENIAPDIIVIHVPLNLSRYVENLIASKWKGETCTVCYGAYPTLFPEKTKEMCTSAVNGDICSVWSKIVADFKMNKMAAVYNADRIGHFNVKRKLETKFGFSPFFSQVRTSFGCHCKEEQMDYCPENILYKNTTRWNIYDTADAIASTTRKALFMLDDDFLHDIDYGMRLLEKCWRYKKMWIFQTTGEIFKQPGLFHRLRDGGVRVIYLKEDWLGRELLENLDKETYLKEKEYQIGMIHNCRITVGCKIRLGYEGENTRFYQRLLKFLIRLKVDIIELAVQTPLPGTKTHQSLLRKGKIVQDLSLYDQWMPVVSTPGMAPQALYTNMEWLRDRFYSWDSIMLRNILVSPRLGFYNTIFFYLLPNLSYRSNFLEKVGYPP